MSVWIELHSGVFTHKKTFLLAHALDISTDRAVVMLMRLWCWAIDNAEDGDLSHVPATAIASIANWDGDATALIQSLCRSGYIDVDDEHACLQLHDWHDYAGRLIEHRRKARERQRAFRAAQTERREDDVTVTVREHTGRSTETSRDDAGTVRSTSATNRNRTVPDRNRTDTIPETGTVVVANAPATPSIESLIAQLRSDDDRESLLDLFTVFPQVTDYDGARQLATAVLTFPHIDHNFEANKCRARMRRSDNWPVTYSNWIAGARYVLYRNGEQGPPHRCPPDLLPPEPLTDEDAAYRDALEAAIEQRATREAGPAP